MASRPDRRVSVLVALLAVLAWYNVTVNLWPSGAAKTIGALALATAIALVAGARAAGMSWAQLGLDPASARSGLRLGLPVAVAAAAANGALLLIPASRRLYEVAEVSGMSVPTLVVETVVRIPTITAGVEELAFRGVLLAALLGVVRTAPAVIVNAVAFGLWHVSSAVQLGGTAADVVAAVAFTTASGFLFAWLRLRSGSLVAPFVVHASANSAALTTAWVVTNQL